MSDQPPVSSSLHDAAPDLLAVLKALLATDAVRYAWDAGPMGEGWQSPALSALFAKAEAAVAKAEGKTP